MSEPNDDMTPPVQSIAASNLYRKMVEEIRSEEHTSELQSPA